MLPNYYDLHERHKELLRQAEQNRLVRQLHSVTLRQRAGGNLLRLGARLVIEDSCYTVKSAGQTVTVCSA